MEGPNKVFSNVDRGAEDQIPGANRERSNTNYRKDPSALGVDLGSNKHVMAAFTQKGVNIVLSETSDKST